MQTPLLWYVHVCAHKGNGLAPGMHPGTPALGGLGPTWPLTPSRDRDLLRKVARWTVTAISPRRLRPRARPELAVVGAPHLLPASPCQSWVHTTSHVLRHMQPCMHLRLTLSQEQGGSSSLPNSLTEAREAGKGRRALAANTVAVSAPAWSWNKQVTQRQMEPTALHTCVRTRRHTPRQAPRSPHRCHSALAGHVWPCDGWGRQLGLLSEARGPTRLCTCACFPLWSQPLCECASIHVCLRGPPCSGVHPGLGGQGPQLGLGTEGQGKAAHPSATW